MTHPDNWRTHYGAVPGRDDTYRQLADTLWSSAGPWWHIPTTVGHIMEQCLAVMTHPDNWRTHYGAVPSSDDTSRQRTDTLWSSAGPWWHILTTVGHIMEQCWPVNSNEVCWVLFCSSFKRVKCLSWWRTDYMPMLMTPHYWQLFASQQRDLLLLPPLTGIWLPFRSGAITGAWYWIHQN